MTLSIILEIHSLKIKFILCICLFVFLGGKLSAMDLTHENPECGVWSSFCVDTYELNVRSKGDGMLQLEIGGNLNGTTDFIQEGLRRLKGGSPNVASVYHCSQVEIIPLDSSDEYCSIDNEEFELKLLQVKALKNQVYFFQPRPMR